MVRRDWCERKENKGKNSSIAHHILFSQTGRKMRDKREYLWWDPPITCVSLHFSLTNQIKEMKKFVLSFPSPLPSLPLFPFPSPPSFCFTKQCYSLIHILGIKITILPNYFFFLLFWIHFLNRSIIIWNSTNLGPITKNWKGIFHL